MALRVARLVKVPVDDVLTASSGRLACARTAATGRRKARSRMAWPHEAPRRRRKTMAGGESGMSGWRVVLNIVGAMLGFLVLGAGGCSTGNASCPPPPQFAYINFECVSTEPPVVKTTGPCTVCPVGQIPDGGHCAVADDSQQITLMASGAGTCHAELTFASGARSSVDIDFVSVPQGCGNEAFFPVGADGGPCAACASLSVPGPICDAGLDAEPSD
jgi:hypothetical protein